MSQPVAKQAAAGTTTAATATAASTAAAATGDRAAPAGSLQHLRLLKQMARRELIGVLDECRGRKVLVIDPRLSGPITLVCDMALLREHGVERLFYLDQVPPDAAFTNVLYLCRPDVGYMRWIAGHIKARSTLAAAQQSQQQQSQHQQSQQQQSQQPHEYTVALVPRRTLACERILEDEGVLGDITLTEFQLDFVMLESDVLSLELDGTFRSLHVDGNNAAIFTAARALMRLQATFGFFPTILGKGDAAKHLAELLVRMRGEILASDRHASPVFAGSAIGSGGSGGSGGALGAGSAAVAGSGGSSSTSSSSSVADSFSSMIDSLIIVDRAADLVTPMCMQLTYEGLVDELFGIRTTFVELESSLAGKSPQQPPQQPSQNQQLNQQHQPHNQQTQQQRKTTKLPLNSHDAVFASIRNLNFSAVADQLRRAARRLSSDFDSHKGAMTLAQVREFARRFGGMQAEHQQLGIHTAITEEILNRTQTRAFHRNLELEQGILGGGDAARAVEFIEELAAKQTPLVQVLRLACLLAVTQGGLKPRQYESLAAEIVAAYGYEHLATLDRLKRAGLLFPAPASAAGSGGSGLALLSGLVPFQFGGGAGSAKADAATMHANRFVEINAARAMRPVAPVAPSDATGGADESSDSQQQQQQQHLHQHGALAAASVADTASDAHGTDSGSGSTSSPAELLWEKKRPAPRMLYGRLRQSLRLIVDDIDDLSPSDVAYVYSGYAPISVRLVQCATRDALFATRSVQHASVAGGAAGAQHSGSRGSSSLARGGPSWHGFEDVLSAVPGVSFEVDQLSLDPGHRASVGGIGSSSSSGSAAHGSVSRSSGATVVFFLGGCTFTEVAALRFLAAKHGRSIIVATTEMLNAGTLLSSMIAERP